MHAPQVIANSRALAARLVSHGYVMATGGSDNHLVLWDLRVRAASPAVVCCCDASLEAPRRDRPTNARVRGQAERTHTHTATMSNILPN